MRRCAPAVILWSRVFVNDRNVVSASAPFCVSSLLVVSVMTATTSRSAFPAAGVIVRPLPIRPVRGLKAKAMASLGSPQRETTSVKMPRHPRLRTPILALAIALACPLLVVLNHAKVVGFETLGLDNALKINAVSIFWLAALLVTRWALSQRQAAFLWDCSVVALPVVWAVLLAR